jgi:hypothetical protein
MPPAKTTQCVKRVFSNYESHLCRRTALFRENGNDWCRIHAPSTAERRKKESEALWERRNARWDAETTEEAAEDALVRAVLLYAGPLPRSITVARKKLERARAALDALGDPS